MIKNVYTNTAVTDGETISAESKSEVKVTVHIPDDISEAVRQQKINRLYDLLKPKKNSIKIKNVA